MTICVFTGPTLAPVEAAKILDAVYLPPAAMGDLYRAAQRRPWAIGVIDGFFESTPSVWHKEVLWAMAQGVHVFGASSMGALRAAELAPFGMVGVGAIYESYRVGEIEDDDEVAVVHGPPELDYVQLSEALVNIRATLRKAVAAAVLSAPTAEGLADIAKSLYYKVRSYDRLLAEARAGRLPVDELARLKVWLPSNQVNQKRLDAIAMLETIGNMRALERAPKSVSYQFEHTVLWDAVEQQFGSTGKRDAAEAGAAASDRLFDELRLDAALYRRTRSAALLRTLARRVTVQQGMEPSLAQLQQATRRFRIRMGFEAPAELEIWVQEQGLSQEEFLRLMGDEARRQILEESLAAAVDRAMLDELMASGDYVRLRTRARDKEELMNSRGAIDPSPSDYRLSEAELLQWFLKECPPNPGEEDVHGLVEQLGFSDVRALLGAALREYCYRLWKDS